MADPVEALLDEGEVVALCNQCLVAAGLIAKVRDVEEVRLVCSSTSVLLAAVENIQRQRIPNTVRRPSTAAQRAHNAIKSIEALQNLLQYDLSHISGERVVMGSMEDIINVLELISAVGQGHPLLDAPPAGGRPMLQGGHPQPQQQQSQWEHQQGDSEYSNEEEEDDEGYSDDHVHADYAGRHAQQQYAGRGGSSGSGSSSSEGSDGEYDGDEGSMPGTSASGRGAGRSGSHTTTTSGSYAAARAKGRRGEGARDGAGRSRGYYPQARASKGQLRALRGAPPHDVSKEAVQGRVRPTAARYGAMMAGPAEAVAAELAAAAMRATRAQQQAARQPGGKAPPRKGSQLSAVLAAKMAHVYNLAMEDPSKAEVRARVQAKALQHEATRQAARRALVARMARALTKREAALASNRERLEERAQEYAERVEKLRLQRLAAEYQMKQKAQAARTATQVEVALREAFLEAIDGERERLLAERKAAAATTASHMPNFRRILARVEGQYREQHGIIEDVAAGERRARMRAEAEALAARRQSNAAQAAALQARMGDMLERVVQEEQALLARRGALSGPGGQQQLLVQLRQMIGLR